MIRWLLVLLLFISSPISAAKVYKWVDEDGNVSYRDKPPPKGSKGKIEEKQIDPDINISRPVPVRKDKKQQKTSATGSTTETAPGQGGLSAPEQGVLENDTSKPPVQGPEKLKPGPGQPVQPGLKPGPAIPPPPPPSSGPGI